MPAGYKAYWYKDGKNKKICLNPLVLSKIPTFGKVIANNYLPTV